MALVNTTAIEQATSISAMSLAINDVSGGIFYYGLLICIFVMLNLAIKSTGFQFYVGVFASSGVCMILSMLLIYLGGVGYAAFALFFVMWVATSIYMTVNR